MDYELRIYTNYSNKVLEFIEDIEKQIFDSPYSIDKMLERTIGKKKSLVLFYFFTFLLFE